MTSKMLQSESLSTDARLLRVTERDIPDNTSHLRSDRVEALDLDAVTAHTRLSRIIPGLYVQQ